MFFFFFFGKRHFVVITESLMFIRKNKSLKKLPNEVLISSFLSVTVGCANLEQLPDQQYVRFVTEYLEHTPDQSS